MATKTYKFGDKTRLSQHFAANEFQCKCGKAHDFQIEDGLIVKLEQLFAELNCSKIIVTSGFRCAAHDKAVGGNGSGQHTLGTAADICCYGQDGKPISSKLVCCKAQDLGFAGIANITAAYQYTHVDVRKSGKWYGDETKGTSTVTSDFYAYFGIDKPSAPTPRDQRRDTDDRRRDVEGHTHEAVIQKWQGLMLCRFLFDTIRHKTIYFAIFTRDFIFL